MCARVCVCVCARTGLAVGYEGEGTLRSLFIDSF